MVSVTVLMWSECTSIQLSASAIKAAAMRTDSLS